MMAWIRFIVAAVCITIGLIVLALSILGVFKFKYVLNRMHAAAMGDTLGLLFIVVGMMILSGFQFLTLKLLLIVIMLWLTSPVASHLIARLEVTTNEKLDNHLKEVKH